jgi:AcrR family transcriptional regulator
MKRKPYPEERQHVLCDAAIEIFAHDGARGLTHRKVEHRAGLPASATASYFRKRSALLRGAAQRVAELVAGDFEAAMSAPQVSDTAAAPTTLSVLAQIVMRRTAGPAVDRALARYELVLHAHRDSAVRRISEESIAGFRVPSERGMTQLQPDGCHDPGLVEEHAYAATTYLNGVIVRQARGDHIVASLDDLTRQLNALLPGIAASHRLQANAI